MVNKKDDQFIKKVVKIFLLNKLGEVMQFLIVSTGFILISLFIGVATIGVKTYGWEWMSMLNGMSMVPFWSWYTFGMGCCTIGIALLFLVLIGLITYLIFDLIRNWLRSNLDKAIKEANER